VDTHIWAIARELFDDAVLTASLTARTYWTVAELYRSTFRDRPGWAQHYLFHQRRSSGKMYASAVLGQEMPVA